MKRKTWPAVITRCLLYLTGFLLSACMKDKVRVTRTYTISTPIYEVLTKFREGIKSLPASAITTTGKITVYGHFIFLSEADKGIHVIDNSNPLTPKNVSFINVPGNKDFAIKDNKLYADSYGDLVTFDITDPLNVVARDFAINVFPDHSIYYSGIYLPGNSPNPDSVNVIIGYTTKDTTVEYDPDDVSTIYTGGCMNCGVTPHAASFSNAATPGNTAGTNGSMARFCIIKNFLYTVGTYDLTTFDISQLSGPVQTGTVLVDYHVETIYPLKEKLFVGTNNGMYMYDVQSTPSQPSLIGQFSHIRGCDPVIADDNYAYITLNDSSACLGFYNQLQIVNIKNMANPFLVESYQFTHPAGLSKDGNNLFICDGREGLKVYNAADPGNLILIKQFKDATVFDVIAEKGLAIVMTGDGIYQYDYADIGNIHFISKL